MTKYSRGPTAGQKPSRHTSSYEYESVSPQWAASMRRAQVCSHCTRIAHLDFDCLKQRGKLTRAGQSLLLMGKHTRFCCSATQQTKVPRVSVHELDRAILFGSCRVAALYSNIARAHVFSRSPQVCLLGLFSFFNIHCRLSRNRRTWLKKKKRVKKEESQKNCVTSAPFSADKIGITHSHTNRNCRYASI
jgi:hypothetical protein